MLFATTETIRSAILATAWLLVSVNFTVNSKLLSYNRHFTYHYFLLLQLQQLSVAAYYLTTRQSLHRLNEFCTPFTGHRQCSTVCLLQSALTRANACCLVAWTEAGDRWLVLLVTLCPMRCLFAWQIALHCYVLLTFTLRRILNEAERLTANTQE